MEILYKLPNGEVFNFSVNKFCSYPTKVTSKDFCRLTPSFSFRFVSDAFEFNSERILSNYGNLLRYVRIYQPDNDLVILLTQGYAFLIYQSKPACYIDLVTFTVLRSFNDKFMLLIFPDYRSILLDIQEVILDNFES